MAFVERLKIKDKYPTVIIYTNALDFPAGTAAWSCENIIIIDESFMDDRGLVAHELHHVEKWFERGCTDNKYQNEYNDEEIECIVRQLIYYIKENNPNYENFFKKLCNDLVYIYKITSNVKETEALLKNKINDILTNPELEVL